MCFLFTFTITLEIRYMSGITLLAADEHVHHAIELAYTRSHFQANTYWIITVGIPKHLQGRDHLAMKTISNPEFKHRKVSLSNTVWKEIIYYHKNNFR